MKKKPENMEFKIGRGTKKETIPAQPYGKSLYDYNQDLVLTTTQKTLKLYQKMLIDSAIRSAINI